MAKLLNDFVTGAKNFVFGDDKKRLHDPFLELYRQCTTHDVPISYFLFLLDTELPKASTGEIDQLLDAMKIHLLERNKNFRRVFCLVVFGMARIGSAKSFSASGGSWKLLEAALRGRLHELVDFSSLFLQANGTLTENAKLLQQSESLMFFIRHWTMNFPFSKCHEAVSKLISMDILLSGGTRPWKDYFDSIKSEPSVSERVLTIQRLLQLVRSHPIIPFTTTDFQMLCSGNRLAIKLEDQIDVGLQFGLSVSEIAAALRQDASGKPLHVLLSFFLDLKNRDPTLDLDDWIQPIFQKCIYDQGGFRSVIDQLNRQYDPKYPHLREEHWKDIQSQFLVFMISSQYKFSQNQVNTVLSACSTNTFAFEIASSLLRGSILCDMSKDQFFGLVSALVKTSFSQEDIVSIWSTFSTFSFSDSLQDHFVLAACRLCATIPQLAIADLALPAQHLKPFPLIKISTRTQPLFSLVVDILSSIPVDQHPNSLIARLFQHTYSSFAVSIEAAGRGNDAIRVAQTLAEAFFQHAVFIKLPREHNFVLVDVAFNSILNFIYLFSVPRVIDFLNIVSPFGDRSVSRTRVKHLVEEVVGKIRSQEYTNLEVNRISGKLPLIRQICTILSMDVSVELEPIGPVVLKLEKIEKILAFLIKAGVPQLHAMKSQLDDLKPFNTRSLRALQNANYSLMNQLRVLTTSKLPGTECTIFFLLDYFVCECESRNGLFRTVFHDCMPRTADAQAEIQADVNWRDIVVRAVKLTNDRLQKLVSGELSISDLGNVLEFFRRQQTNISGDIQSIIESPASLLESKEARAQEFLQSALKIMQYLANLPDIVQSMEAFGVVSAYDTDFTDLKSLCDANAHLTLKLKELPDKFRQLQDLLEGIEIEHLSIFKAVRQCDALIKFFRENDFHSAAGHAKFQALRQEINLRLRNDQFKNTLFNTVTFAHRCLSPFIQQNTTLRSVLALTRQLNDITVQNVDCLQQANENIVHIRLLFEEATSSNTQNVQRQVEMLLASGNVVFSLQHLIHDSSSFLIQYSVDDKSKVLTLSQLDTLEVRRQAVFFSKDTQEDRPIKKMEQFEACLSNLDKVFALFLELESSGHPKYQASTKKFRLQSFEDFTEKIEELEKNLKSWRSSLEQARESFSVLLPLTNHDICNIRILLTPSDPCFPIVLRGMLGDHEMESGETQLKCLTTFINCYPRRFHQELGDVDQKLMACLPDFEMSTAFDRDLEFVALFLSQFISLDDLDTKIGKQVVVVAQKSDDNEPTGFLMQFLMTVFEELPGNHNILWGSGSTKEEDVELFFRRAQHFQDNPYVLMGVDSLTFSVREKLQELQQSISGLSHSDIYYVYLDTPNVAISPPLSLFHEDLRDIEEIRGAYLSLVDKRPHINATSILGNSGVGKSHYIKQCVNELIKEDLGVEFLTIAINESLQVHTIIQVLASATSTSAIHFNISPLANIREVERFFFDFLVVGVLRDPASDFIFVPPCNINWTCFIEVPARDANFIVLSACSSSKTITMDSQPWLIGEDELEICRDLLAYFPHDPSRRPIDKMALITGSADVPVELPPLPTSNTQEVCRKVLRDVLHTMAPNANRDMTTRAFFMSFLAERFNFFQSPAYIYNTSIQGLGSRFLEQFLTECNFLCQPRLNCDWTESSTTYLVVNTDASFWPLPPKSNFNKIPSNLRNTFQDTISELQGKKNLFEEYLGWMLNISASLVHKVALEMQFVLTGEFFYKIFLIHQRKVAQLPVILQGETGVGKTFLLEFYALLLYQQSLHDRSNVESPFLLGKACAWMRVKILPLVQAQLEPAAFAEINRQLANEDHDAAQLVTMWRQLLDCFAELGGRDADDSHPMLQLLSFIEELRKKFPLLDSLSTSLAQDMEQQQTPVLSQKVLKQFLDTPLLKLFHRLLIHPDVTAIELEKFLDPIFHVNRRLPSATQIVFLDEVNTSSCLGTIKEIVMDRKFNGKEVPANILFVCAINPDRSQQSHKDVQGVDAFTEVHRALYHVHPLPASMESLIWQFNGMNKDALHDYIKRKIDLQKLSSASKRFDECIRFQCSEFIMTAQHFFIDNFGPSSVSQRDVQRVFTLLKFFLEVLFKDETGDKQTLFIKSVFLAIGLVYYFRLPVVVPGNKPTRSTFDAIPIFGDLDFKQIIESSLESFVTRENFQIPEGVALNKALQENLFAITACVVSFVPIGIFGAPGSSKTLSFQIIRDNLKGKASPMPFCRRFPALDCFFYQCSEFSTAAEINNIFERAITRQAQFDKNETRVVVFLDEASLPKEDLKRMVLKALHPFLDDCKVSFICISNQTFDAANANRLVQVRRTQATIDDLEVLAQGCAGLIHQDLTPPIRKFLRGLCLAYEKVLKLKEFKERFHYRDLIYTIRKIAHMSNGGIDMSPLALLQSLEENFNGVERSLFERLVAIFFECVQSELGEAFQMPHLSKFRDVVQVLKDSLRHSPFRAHSELPLSNPYASRFKMLIDPTSNNTGLQLLQSLGLVDFHKSHVFRMSNLPNDSTNIHASEVLSGIKTCIETPTTLVLVNTERVHGALYDFLNQNYRRVGGTSKDEPLKLFSVLAIGSETYPCQVSEELDCIVVVPLSRVDSIPAPFLSRFSKFFLSVDDLLQLRIQTLSKEQQLQVQTTANAMRRFVTHFGEDCFPGYDAVTTIPSLLLSHIIQTATGESLFVPFDQSTCFEQRNVSQLMQVGTTVRLFVRAMYMQLLKLALPEMLVLKLPSFANPDYLLRTYFEVQDHFNLGSFLERALSALGHRSEVSDLGLPGATKHFVITRSSASVQSLLKTPHEVLGDVSKICEIVQASSFSQKSHVSTVMEQFSARVDKRVLIIVTSLREATDLSLICQLIDDTDKSCIAKEDKKLFVVLFTIPPEHINTRLSSVSAMFLNDWDSCFIDVTTPAACQFVRKTAVACLSFDVIPSEEVRRYVTSSFGIEPYLPTIIAQFFERFQPNLLHPPNQLNPAAACIYGLSRVSDKRRALQSILQKAPSVLEFIESKYFSQWRPTSVQKLLLDVAERIAGQRTLLGFATAIYSFYERIVLHQFCHVVFELSKDFGLHSLMSSGPTMNKPWITALLNLIPDAPALSLKSLGKYKQLSTFHFTSSSNFVPQTLLFPALFNRLEHHRKEILQQIDDSKDFKAIIDRVSSDQQLVSLSSIDGFQTILESYLDDCISRKCTEITSSNRGGNLSSSLLMLLRKTIMLSLPDQESDSQLAKLAMVHMTIVRQSDLLERLYFGGLAFETIEKIPGFDDAQTIGILEQDFFDSLLKSLWKTMTHAFNVDSDSPTVDQVVLQKWITAFRFVSEFYAAGMQEVSDQHSDLSNQASTMKFIFSFLTFVPSLVHERPDVLCNTAQQCIRIRSSMSLKGIIDRLLVLNNDLSGSLDALADLRSLLFSLLCSFISALPQGLFKPNSSLLFSVLNDTSIPKSLGLTLGMKVKLLQMIVAHLVPDKGSLQPFIDEFISSRSLAPLISTDVYVPLTERQRDAPMAEIFSSPIFDAIFLLEKQVMKQFAIQRIYNLAVSAPSLASPYSFVKQAAAKSQLFDVLNQSISLTSGDVFSGDQASRFSAMISEHGLLHGKDQLFLFLNRMISKHGLNNAVSILHKWTHPWAKDLAQRLTLGKIEVRESFPSFMIPVQLGNATISAFDSLRPVYSAFSSAFSQFVQSQESNVWMAWCQAQIVTPSFVAGLSNQRILSMLLLFKVYYDYFCKNSLAELTPLQLSPQTLVFLGLRPEEFKIIQLFLDPEHHIRGWGAQDALHELFRPEMNNENLLVRDLMVNQLGFILATNQTPLHLSTWLFTPQSMVNSAVFGGTKETAILGQGGHFDCSHKYSETGTPNSVLPTMTTQSTRLSTMTQFTSLCMYQLAFQTDPSVLNGPILSPDLVTEPQFGQTIDVQLPNFCMQRVNGPFMFIRNLGHGGEFSPEVAALQIENALELVFSKHLTQPGLFTPTFTSQQCPDAERAFTAAVNQAIEGCQISQAAFDSLRVGGDFVTELESYKASLQNPTEQKSRYDAVVNMIQDSTDESPSIQLLKRVLNDIPKLETLKLVPAVLQLHRIIHRDLAFRVKEDELVLPWRQVVNTVFDKFKMSSKTLGFVEEGVNAYNEMLKLMEGAYQEGCAAGAQQLPRITNETPFMMLISSSVRDFDGHDNVLFKVIEHAIRAQEDFIGFCAKNDGWTHEQLEGSSLSDQLPITSILHCNEAQNGLMKLSCSDFQDLCLLHVQSSNLGVSMSDLSQMHHHVVIEFVSKCFSYNLDPIRSSFSFLRVEATSRNQEAHDVADIEDLDPGFVQLFPSAPVSSHVVACCKASLSSQPYDETLTIARDFVALSRSIVRSQEERSQEIGREMTKEEISQEVQQLTNAPLSGIFDDLGFHPANATRLFLTALTEPIQLRQLSTLYQLICEHFFARQYLQSHIPAILQAPLTNYQKTEMKALLDSTLTSSDILIRTREMASALALLEIKMDQIHKKPDQLLISYFTEKERQMIFFSILVESEELRSLTGRHYAKVLELYLTCYRQLRQGMVSELRSAREKYQDLVQNDNPSDATTNSDETENTTDATPFGGDDTLDDESDEESAPVFDDVGKGGNDTEISAEQSVEPIEDDEMRDVVESGEQEEFYSPSKIVYREVVQVSSDQALKCAGIVVTVELKQPPQIVTAPAFITKSAIKANFPDRDIKAITCKRDNLLQLACKNLGLVQDQVVLCDDIGYQLAETETPSSCNFRLISLADMISVQVFCRSLSQSGSTTVALSLVKSAILEQVAQVALRSLRTTPSLAWAASSEASESVLLMTEGSDSLLDLSLKLEFLSQSPLQLNLTIHQTKFSSICVKDRKQNITETIILSISDPQEIKAAIETRPSFMTRAHECVLEAIGPSDGSFSFAYADTDEIFPVDVVMFDGSSKGLRCVSWCTARSILDHVFDGNEREIGRCEMKCGEVILKYEDQLSKVIQGQPQGVVLLNLCERTSPTASFSKADMGNGYAFSLECLLYHPRVSQIQGRLFASSSAMTVGDSLAFVASCTEMDVSELKAAINGSDAADLAMSLADWEELEAAELTVTISLADPLKFVQISKESLGPESIPVDVQLNGTLIHSVFIKSPQTTLLSLISFLHSQGLPKNTAIGVSDSSLDDASLSFGDILDLNDGVRPVVLEVKAVGIQIHFNNASNVFFLEDMDADFDLVFDQACQHWKIQDSSVFPVVLWAVAKDNDKEKLVTKHHENAPFDVIVESFPLELHSFHLRLPAASSSE